MGSGEGTRHRVAVIRVEAPARDDEFWRIDLFEVLPHAGRDRLIGRAHDTATACLILRRWLDGPTDDTGGAGTVTPD